ncbi:DEAD/DEAH box helicase [bacterium]|nr:DEAD/DEAH box helicase [bacterium]
MSKSDADNLKKQIPIQYIMNFLSDRIPESRGGKPKIAPKSLGDKVVVVKASTGSGKSTTFPVSLYETFTERTRKNIVITQPRVLTCIDIPQSILQWAKELAFDKNIGYNTGNYKRLPKEKGIIFCTTEIITQQLLMAETPEDFMKKYQFIIIDEVHTRDLAIDRLLFLMKKLLAEHYDDPECPTLRCRVLHRRCIQYRRFRDQLGGHVDRRAPQLGAHAGQHPGLGPPGGRGRQHDRPVRNRRRQHGPVAIPHGDGGLEQPDRCPQSHSDLQQSTGHRIPHSNRRIRSQWHGDNHREGAG